MSILPQHNNQILFQKKISQAYSEEEAYRNLSSYRSHIDVFGFSSETISIHVPRLLETRSRIRINLNDHHVKYWKDLDKKELKLARQLFDEANKKARDKILQLEKELIDIASNLAFELDNLHFGDEGYNARKTSEKFGI